MPALVGAFVAIGVIALWLLVMIGFRLRARRPDDLGVRAGRLVPCPAKPNCVNSQATASHQYMEPLTFTGSPAAALAHLKTVLAGYPRVRIIAADDGYLHAEFRSFLFRFVDDVEFLIDGATPVIHFRSASRSGHSDFGVNRRRMEALRRAFESAVG